MRRTALVTGAGRGIGRAIVEALAGEAWVAGIDVAFPEGPGAASLVEQADVADRGAMSRALGRIAEEGGGIDWVVCAAGITRDEVSWRMSDADWDDVLAVNLRGVLFGCQIAGLHMRELGWGRIVNLASLAGQQGGLVAGAHYAASKAGIIVLTKIAAAALAASGVTVNAVSPAAIDGPVMASLPAERVKELAERIPVGRVGRPEEVGALVAYLVSEEAAYATGATFDLNGGLFMR